MIRTLLFEKSTPAFFFQIKGDRQKISPQWRDISDEEFYKNATKNVGAQE